MTILVTGGAGFIGSHLIERLLQSTDRNILCLDDFNDYYAPTQKRTNAANFADNPRVRVLEHSICNEEFIENLFTKENITDVFHLAAYAGVRHSVENPMPFTKANIEGTQVLLEAVRKHPVERFVFASSSTVYGNDAVTPFAEDAPLGIPCSPYGVTKRSAELMALAYHQLFNVPVVCLRLFSVYGPRVRPDLALYKFADAILNGKELTLLGDGTARRDFTHVADVCDGFLAAIQKPAAIGECINLGHNHPIEIRVMIQQLEQAFSQKAIIQKLPARTEDMQVTCAKLEKAKAILEWESKTDFSDGVLSFVEWFKGQAKS